MRRDESFVVIENAELAKGICHLRLKRNTPPDSIPIPGQFAMVQVREGAAPLLRRPLSYLHADENSVQFLYRVAGIGTRILSSAQPGNSLNVLGPLGRGFDLQKAKRRAMLVAGGMGLPPLFYLALEMKRTEIKACEFIHGAVSAIELVLTSALEKEGIAVHRATEDGSLGFRGKASELLKELLQSTPKPDIIYACGPHLMLKAVADIARSENISCEVSVEANMACGIGACLGCAIQTTRGEYLQVCRDGPVFDAKTLFG